MKASPYSARSCHFARTPQYDGYLTVIGRHQGLLRNALPCYQPLVILGCVRKSETEREERLLVRGFEPLVTNFGSRRVREIEGTHLVMRAVIDSVALGFRAGNGRMRQVGVTPMYTDHMLGPVTLNAAKLGEAPTGPIQLQEHGNAGAVQKHLGFGGVQITGGNGLQAFTY
jgi:hypothetical protein